MPPPASPRPQLRSLSITAAPAHSLCLVSGRRGCCPCEAGRQAVGGRRDWARGETQLRHPANTREVSLDPASKRRTFTSPPHCLPLRAPRKGYPAHMPGGLTVPGSRAPSSLSLWNRAQTRARFSASPLLTHKVASHPPPPHMGGARLCAHGTLPLPRGTPATGGFAHSLSGLSPTASPTPPRNPVWGLLPVGEVEDGILVEIKLTLCVPLDQKFYLQQ